MRKGRVSPLLSFLEKESWPVDFRKIGRKGESETDEEAEEETDEDGDRESPRSDGPLYSGKVMPAKVVSPGAQINTLGRMFLLRLMRSSRCRLQEM